MREEREGEEGRREREKVREGEGEGERDREKRDTNDGVLNLFQFLAIQTQTIWLLYIFLHENGRHPECTITFSAGEALLSYH